MIAGWRIAAAWCTTAIAARKADSTGRLNASKMDAYHGQQETTFGSVHTSAIAVAWSTASGHAARATAVLDAYRGRDQQRGGCNQSRSVVTCWNQMVPEGGRYGTSHVQVRGEAAVR